MKMSEEFVKILKYNQRQKSMKIPLALYVDIESLHEKLLVCDNNPEKLSAGKTSKHTVCYHSLFTRFCLEPVRNKYDYNRSKSCVENF